MAENPQKQTAWICRLDQYPPMILHNPLFSLVDSPLPPPLLVDCPPKTELFLRLPNTKLCTIICLCLNQRGHRNHKKRVQLCGLVFEFVCLSIRTRKKIEFNNLSIRTQKSGIFDVFSRVFASSSNVCLFGLDVYTYLFKQINKYMFIYIIRTQQKRD